MSNIPPPDGAATTAAPPIEPADDSLGPTATQVRRITVNLRASDIERIDEIAERTGLTANEILRRSLATESFMQRTRSEGRKVLVSDADGDDIREVEFLY